MAIETSSINIRPGDTIKVWQKIKEGDKTRLQAFEGMVIARKHGNEPGATFTVRRMFGDIGVEKIFPLYSPNINKIETISHSKTRRAKLYYIREKAAKEIRKKMKQIKAEAKKPVRKETEEEKISTTEEK